MGQKVHPNGIRLGIVKPWNATWFANTKDFADNLDGDFKVRQFLTNELKKASAQFVYGIDNDTLEILNKSFENAVVKNASAQLINSLLAEKNTKFVWP